MAQQTTILLIPGLAAAYLVAGLALQHAAYILQYGSIFTPLRNWLERTACAPGSPRALRWLCARARDLVGCQLCSITQLALWFCAVPATILAVGWFGSRPFGLTPGVAAVGYTTFGLGVMFSTAAAGMLCWDAARLVGRGSDALILYLRARKDLAESEARLAAARDTRPAAEPAPAREAAQGLRILPTAPPNAVPRRPWQEPREPGRRRLRAAPESRRA